MDKPYFCSELGCICPLTNNELAQKEARIEELKKQHSDFLDALEPYLENIEAGLKHIEAIEIFMNARSAIS